MSTYFLRLLYKRMLLQSVAAIVVNRTSLYRSTQPTYYQMSTRPSSVVVSFYHNRACATSVFSPCTSQVLDPQAFAETD